MRRARPRCAGRRPPRRTCSSARRTSMRRCAMRCRTWGSRSSWPTRGPAQASDARRRDLLARAARSAAQDDSAEASRDVGEQTLASRSPEDGQYVVRLVAVPPKGRASCGCAVEEHRRGRRGRRARAGHAARDPLDAGGRRASVEAEREEASRGTAQGILSPARSQGRAVLAINMGAFGAFTAYALERASGSVDPRVLYPLLAVGTGTSAWASGASRGRTNGTSRRGDAW